MTREEIIALFRKLFLKRAEELGSYQKQIAEGLLEAMKAEEEENPDGGLCVAHPIR